MSSCLVPNNTPALTMMVPTPRNAVNHPITPAGLPVGVPNDAPYRLDRTPAMTRTCGECEVS